MRNTLFYGDNLDITRAHIPNESVDLVLLGYSLRSGGKKLVCEGEQGELDL